MNFFAVLQTEALKLRRSKITWISLVFYVFFALMAYFVLWIIKNPELARGLGLVGQKVNFVSSGLVADWRGLYTFFAELCVMGGMILYSIIVIYLFGREYAEGTAKNMLALPVRRSYFVLAKTCVGLAWYALLTFFLLAEALLVGAALGLGAPSWELVVGESADILVGALLVCTLQPLVAWVTVASGGYLAPFGYTIATLIVGNLMIRTDWARWCPWSIVALLSGLMGPRDETVLLGSTLVLAATFVIGMGGTILRQSRADNCQ